jgi:dTDP-D-glucose 4,6-dehydratase
VARESANFVLVTHVVASMQIEITCNRTATFRKKIPLHGDGSYIRSWLRGDYTAAAIPHSVNQGAWKRIYSVSGNYEASNKEVIATFLHCHLKKEIPFGGFVEFI